MASTAAAATIGKALWYNAVNLIYNTYSTSRILLAWSLKTKWTSVRYLLSTTLYTVSLNEEGQIISRVFPRSRALAFSRCFFFWGFWVLSPWLICRKLKEETGFAAGILHSHLLMTTNHLISLLKLGTTETYSATFLPKPVLMPFAWKPRKVICSRF